MTPLQIYVIASGAYLVGFIVGWRRGYRARALRGPARRARE